MVLSPPDGSGLGYPQLQRHGVPRGQEALSHGARPGAAGLVGEQRVVTTARDVVLAVLGQEGQVVALAHRVHQGAVLLFLAETDNR